MAKQTALGSNLYWGTADLSGDVGALTSAETLRGVLDVTGMNQSAMERVLARRDGSLAFSAFWNTAVGQAHLTLSALPRTDVQVSAVMGTPAVGSACCSLNAKQITYGPTFGDDGSLVASLTASANGTPLEWGEILTTGKQTFASGTVNGTSIDLGAASTDFGAAAYLHVFSLGSGTPTVAVADSANNSAFAAVTGLSFTPTVAGVERKQTAALATVRQYVRIQVSGTYTALVCALNFVRYTEDPA